MTALRTDSNEGSLDPSIHQVWVRTDVCAAGLLAWLAGGQDRRSARAAPGGLPVATAVLRRPLFWRIAIGGALGLGAQVGFLAHQIPPIAEVRNTSDRHGQDDRIKGLRDNHDEDGPRLEDRHDEPEQ